MLVGFREKVEEDIAYKTADREAKHVLQILLINGAAELDRHEEKRKDTGETHQDRAKESSKPL